MTSQQQQAPRTIPMPELNCHNDNDSSLLASIGDNDAIVRHSFQNQTPVLLRGAVKDANALDRWKSWDYIEKSVDGETTCHVEVGGNYAQSSERCDIRFGDYLAYLRLFEKRHGRRRSNNADAIPNDDELIYLAQNDAFEGLFDDFVVPDFCQSLGEGKLYSTMVWIGPYGCSFPLHFDPMDNALMQFVGTKKVLMYPPEAFVYAGHDGNHTNTSPINPERAIDLDEYPLARDLPSPFECKLEPGDLLYIPKKWWHYVRTVETSISVNCWFR